uniref:Forkhead box P3b n=1 Tax=Tetraodon nigroviridis TaxID=99883 RepID=H3CGX0_TETNG
SSTLFVSGLCRWPGCGAVSEDFPSFLKHLQSEHGRCDRSLAQWRVQQDIVQCLETQLVLEKQKLFAMQLHLQRSENQHSDSSDSDGNFCLNLLIFLTAEGRLRLVPQPPAVPAPNRRNQRRRRSAVTDTPTHPGPGDRPDRPDRPDHLVQSLECYQHANIRPPYTYAYMIRWSIMDSPEKQRTLNEIYNWFTTKFFYFRNNTATWKNAVRHNLSLHKCFVRVEGGKGAVWTVDETEYQRRKGQK